MTGEANITPVYPVQFEITREAEQSRITNFPVFIGMIIRSILLIPHVFVLYIYGFVAFIVYFVATIAILFGGVYPDGMYRFVVTFVRWSARVNAYLLSLFDRYPPFHGAEDQSLPLSFTVLPPATSSRILNFPVFAFLIRPLLLFPHIVIVTFLGVAMFVVVFIAQFAILFSGSFPEGMHGFCVGVSRWSVRLTSYMFGLTDRYPPFSMS